MYFNSPPMVTGMASTPSAIGIGAVSENCTVWDANIQFF
ncbi:MAG: hypothetical protein K0S44_273 [Bacteroidetes bacterium]|jgi:hypothetical protein|nr:hypothetical protein [Bacteroidota bacterium]